MHAPWNCRQLHPHLHHRQRFPFGWAMRSPDAAGRAERLPPWFLRSLTAAGQARLRQWLASQSGSHTLLEQMTFADAAAILRAAGRPPITETGIYEWQIEVLHQLKRLVERPPSPF